MIGALLLMAMSTGPVAPAAAGPGALVLHGGGAGSETARRRALELAGGPAACVLVVPQAAADAAEAGRDLAAWFRQAGARTVEVLQPAEGPGAVAAVERADLVWITSGNQSRLMAALQAAGVAGAIRRHHAAGAVVGGTSAGMAAVSGVMIAGSPETPDGPTPTAAGLDLWPGVLVDQHFVARGREPRLRRALRDHPGLLGVGIDEGCFVVVHGRTFTVAGTGSVVVIRDPNEGAPAVVVPVGAAHDLQRSLTVFP